MGLKEEVLQVAREGKAALVVGLGVSGVATAKFLLGQGLRTIAFERQSEDEYIKNPLRSKEVADLRKEGAEVFFGIDAPATCPEMDDVGICVLSPGVSTKHPLLKLLKGRGVPCIGELELGAVLLNRRSVIVTGSNGKSTTVSLIDEMLKRSGVESTLCGNVGLPVVSVLNQEGKIPEKKSQDVLVVEASSYQLETCTRLRPEVGVFLNLSENHLERHGTIEDYALAKRKLFAKQSPNEFAVLNADDRWSRAAKETIRAKILLFGKEVQGEGTARIIYASEKGEDRIEVSWNGEKFSLSLQECPLKGLHNRYNIAASVLASLPLGATFQGINHALQMFRGLKHRLEVVRDGGVIVINDSKSTTVASTVAALETIYDSYPGLPIVLMIGGLSKRNSWAPLNEVLNPDRVKALVCFGKDGRKIASELPAKDLAISVTDTLKEGISLAFKKASGNGVILFSPACASFDEFRDFEDRGEKFKEYVKEI